MIPISSPYKEGLKSRDAERARHSLEQLAEGHISAGGRTASPALTTPSTSPTDQYMLESIWHINDA